VQDAQPGVVADPLTLVSAERLCDVDGMAVLDGGGDVVEKRCAWVIGTGESGAEVSEGGRWRSAGLEQRREKLQEER
jgi:hypothetical protein